MTLYNYIRANPRWIFDTIITQHIIDNLRHNATQIDKGLPFWQSFYVVCQCLYFAVSTSRKSSVSAIFCSVLTVVPVSPRSMRA